MLFSDLPFEIISIILQCYHKFHLQELRSGKDYYENTLLLAHINQKTRAVALSDRSLWSYICLHWPSKVVNLCLQRARLTGSSEIRVSLDTRDLGTYRRGEAHDNCAQFLEKELKNIVELELKIHRHRGSQCITDVINRTSAPRLQGLIIHLGGGIQHVTNLFNSDAPVLRIARIYSNLQFNLSSITSLRELLFKVGPRNFRGLLRMLGEIHSLEMISLIGTPDESAIPDPLDQHVILPSCEFLNIKNMDSHRVHYILSNILVPKLRILQIREKMVQLTDGSFVLSLLSTVPVLSLPIEAQTNLWLGLHPERVVVSMAGYHFESKWDELRVDEHISLASIIERAVVAPAFN
ncbi:hypothetical protein SISNIDRAFT_485230 [Sistotremastrum niveocremeum HHB9708]|uniref:F-box domain-containing protein n=1 Tax=Sistotremastrum niveocremeum HHB9708 TaxID=1314777 RepID=A0A164UX79_9AGAM|nr:hypothetical protein SISNIDRAFT_485230 [Sistotremastrum niveocremeum HHB9708]